MKTTLSIIGIASLALVGFSSEALAQGPHNLRSEQCLASAAVTFQQQRQIERFRANAFQESRWVRMQIDRTEAELRYLTLRSRHNQIAIAQRQSELRSLRAHEQGIWATYEMQVRSTLGPRQRIAMDRCSMPPRPFPAPVWTNRPAPVGRIWASQPAPVVSVRAPGPRPMGRR